MYLDKEKIISFLPHRDPFLFLDSIESIKKNDKELEAGDITTNNDTLGVEIEANFHVRDDLQILRGHFPGNPILPGVVQVEMMAQASCFAITVRAADPFNINLDVAFMGINNSKFRKPVVPGMNLKIKCICTKCRGAFNNPIMSYDCKIFHEDILMSETTILAMVKY